MTRILAIDPGTAESAAVLYDTGGTVLHAVKGDNADILNLCRGADGLVEQVVIEKIESYGMAVGAETFETVYWSGRFAEAAEPLPVHRLPRRAVKLALCGQARAKDSNIRQALIDRFGGSAAIGRKATPGPLYGLTGDMWAALAVAVTWSDAQQSAA